MSVYSGTVFYHTDLNDLNPISALTLSKTHLHVIFKSVSNNRLSPIMTTQALAWAILLTAVQFLLSHSFTLEINHTNLHAHVTEEQWNRQIHPLFASGQKVTELILNDIILSEQALAKLLREEDLSGLKALNLTSVVLTAGAIQMILAQELLYSQLEQLVLDSCNLQSEDFSSILEPRDTKLHKLSLAGNFITRQGFQSLTRLKMNLRYLSLSENSLIDTESVEALIALGLGQVEELYVGFTSISSDNLIRLLRATDSLRLSNLSIRLHTFPIKFYEQFSELALPNLVSLDICGMLIGEQEVEYLSRMSFPSVELLNLHENQLESKDGMLFLTKKRFPRLSKLDINSNFLKSDLMRHLRHQGFIFQEFRCRIIRMYGEGLEELSLMDLSQLQRLQFEYTSVKPRQMEAFIRDTLMPVIKIIKFTGLRNVGNVLDWMSRDQWPYLEELELSQLGDLEESVWERADVFPNLKSIIFRVEDMENAKIWKFIHLIQQMAPNLHNLQLACLNPYSVLYEILKGNLTHSQNSDLHLKIKKATIGVQKSDQQYFLIQLSPTQKPKMMLTPTFQMLIDNLVKYEYENAHLEKWLLSQEEFLEKLEYWSNRLQATLDFSHVENCKIQGIDNFIIFWPAQNNSICLIDELRVLKFQGLETAEILGDIKICRFSSLRQLSIEFKQEEVNLEIEGMRYETINLSNMKYLQSLEIKWQIPPEQVVRILKESQLEHLTKLTLNGVSLKAGHLEELFESCPWLGRIRELDLRQNNFGAGIAFLEPLRLKNLELSQNMVGDRVQELCAVNYEFMKLADLGEIDLKDRHLIELVECLAEKGKGGFPHMEILSLYHNGLEMDGIDTLMNSDMLPLICKLYLQDNNDPEIFNAVIGSNSSRRLFEFSSFENSMTSIDPNINPKNTRRLENLVIEVNSLRDTDFDVLSNMDFFSLSYCSFVIKKVQKCSSFSAIKDIQSNSNSLELIMLESANISTECLKDGVLDSQRNLHIIPFSIIIMGFWPYVQLRYFAESFLNKNQQLSMLLLDSTYVSDSKILEMTQFSRISKIIFLHLSKNNLTDTSIKHLLNTDFPILQHMLMLYNHITSEGLSLMQGRVYPKLSLIDFSRTYIGDEGIKFLTTNEFPVLRIIWISDIDLTSVGLSYLSSLKAPELETIDLSCNGLTAGDLESLQVSNFLNLKSLIVFPTMKHEDLERLTISLNKGRDGINSAIVKITTDVVYLGDEEF